MERRDAGYSRHHSLRILSTPNSTFWAKKKENSMTYGQGIPVALLKPPNRVLHDHTRSRSTNFNHGAKDVPCDLQSFLVWVKICSIITCFSRYTSPQRRTRLLARIPLSQRHSVRWQSRSASVPVAGRTGCSTLLLVARCHSGGSNLP